MGCAELDTSLALHLAFLQECIDALERVEVVAKLGLAELVEQVE
jgi:hypothetical protein